VCRSTTRAPLTSRGVPSSSISRKTGKVAGALSGSYMFRSVVSCNGTPPAYMRVSSSLKWGVEWNEAVSGLRKEGVWLEQGVGTRDEEGLNDAREEDTTLGRRKIGLSLFIVWNSRGQLQYPLL